MRKQISKLPEKIADLARRRTLNSLLFITQSGEQTDYYTPEAIARFYHFDEEDSTNDPRCIGYFEDPVYGQIRKTHIPELLEPYLKSGLAQEISILRIERQSLELRNRSREVGYRADLNRLDEIKETIGDIR
jgi:hypothetical protein